MASPTEAINASLQRLEKTKKSFLAGEANSLDAVLDAAHAVLVAGGRNVDNSSVVLDSGHEKPSDFLQRVMWAEVCRKISFKDPQPMRSSLSMKTC